MFLDNNCPKSTRRVSFYFRRENSTQITGVFDFLLGTIILHGCRVFNVQFLRFWEACTAAANEELGEPQAETHRNHIQ